MSASLYNTFGNEVQYKIAQDTLVAYIDNASIKFPLPEASSEILAEIAAPKDTPIDPSTLSVIETKLEAIGFKKSNARAMSRVLIKVAEVQGLHPTTYFEMNQNSLKLTVDAYAAINAYRPAGNKIDLKQPTLNSRSKLSNLIKP
ncbi:hypothetical protein N9C44_01835 [bacterium]|jgi:hypothetical protein|nr:hypothetical protein [bacterium]|tara:strand:- start:30 stop:464 length:435 start_codon:yes stop_codon:yes gene_type:complete